MIETPANVYMDTVINDGVVTITRETYNKPLDDKRHRNLEVVKTETLTFGVEELGQVVKDLTDALIMHRDEWS